jgi:hypothetical protein
MTGKPRLFDICEEMSYAPRRKSSRPDQRGPRIPSHKSRSPGPRPHPTVLALPTGHHNNNTCQLRSCGKGMQVSVLLRHQSRPYSRRNLPRKLTKSTLHTHVHAPPAAYKSTFLTIPSKAVTNAFTCMPKKSAPHRDGWTWEQFRDVASRPSTAGLLRKFMELCVNGT